MSTFAEFVALMSKLRSQDGCPWDREQSHRSLRPYLVEEAYEVLEAIDSGDDDKLKEELGDLLLQIVFHAQIASEENRFDIAQVISCAVAKLKRRHPHVFGPEKARDSAEVVRRWEEIKLEGRQEKGSILDGVPRDLPSLLRAHRVQEKVSRVGFDWEDIQGVLDKVEEEFAEFRRALLSGRLGDVEEELGDILFSLVNLARHLNASPEDALRGTIDKFIRRFRWVEKQLANEGKSLPEMSLAELDRLWEQSKKHNEESP